LRWPYANPACASRWIESQPPRRPAGWDARIYAISPANAAFLESIGPGGISIMNAWHRFVPCKSTAMATGRLDFRRSKQGVSELGWIVESSLMACEFWESAKRQANLTLFCPAVRASRIRHDAAVLRLSDGAVLSARLLVGADGRDSWVRQSAGLAAVNTPYREKGVVANFSTEKPHRNTAFQWFRNDGVLAYLPLPGNRISIVWSRRMIKPMHFVRCLPKRWPSGLPRPGRTLGVWKY
jgi:2-polyprenyl-6-methoxyphenol hydroxylase-like FAD-dependent oxidoreductase